MSLINNFKYVSFNENRNIPPLYKDMTYLRYSIASTDPEIFIPLRWHTFYDYEDSTVIEAVLDRPVGGFTEMSVSFDYTNCVSSVELVTEHGSTRHLSWDRSPYLRAELFYAVKFLRSFIPNHGYLRVWKVWEKNFEIMETL